MTPPAENPPPPRRSKDRLRNLLQKPVRGVRTNPEILSFIDLYRRESRRLDGNRDTTHHVPALRNEPEFRTGPAAEPAISFTPHDRLGLALSGGGIRSATFNLGVLQTLARLQILPHVDYLATVSGGGYIGGFWTAWLRRNGNAEAAHFPVTENVGDGERPEIRHLREFSRFLLPRMGVSQTEFWAIAMTVLGGMLPSFLAALSVLTLGWYLWIFGLIALTLPGLRGQSVSSLAFLLYLAVSEILWRNAGRAEKNPRETRSYAIAGLAAAAFLFWRVYTNIYFPDLQSWTSFADPETATAIPRALLLTTLVLLFIRVMAARFFRSSGWIPALVGVERCLIRMIGLTCAMFVVAGLWLLSSHLAQAGHTLELKLTAGGAAVSAGIFAWAKKFLTEPVQETRGGTFLDFLRSWIKRAAPKALASLVWLLLFILVGAAVHRWGAMTVSILLLAFWKPCLLAIMVLVVVAWTFDPARVGMHEFYRSRISRCYLGASNIPRNPAAAQYIAGSPYISSGSASPYTAPAAATPASTSNPAASTAPASAATASPTTAASTAPVAASAKSSVSTAPRTDARHATAARSSEDLRAAGNRQIAERPGDDLRLGELRDIPRPILLVCVAANDMSGDPLGNLYRGARSAVLSGEGITLGNQTAPIDDLRLSSALTASAAAFNSQMGRVSMDLGPAVGFLMSALNLRLGLWVPHPSNRYRGDYIMPGRFFLAELLGFSRTDWSNLHLSDGNHFENFGLYELVRRHCRYIIASDCGSDREGAFDDLANVLRRVREDFGVEIELDIAALRSDGTVRAQQHAVIGTIHYDGLGGVDKGTLLFIKPTLTGDEPPDVLQYATRNREFPQESTGNQFYHEAQWESYRRLGEHAADSVLGFFEPPAAAEVNIPDRLFRDARSRWQAAPANQQINFLDVNDRCSSLEQDLMSEGPEHLRAEFFAEATALAELSGTADSAARAEASALPDLPSELKTLGYLVRVGQIMEDMWVGAELDRYWAHPLYEGWMNYFRRWAATPSFRRWWPVIASLYSLGLREFVRERFHVGAADPDSTRSSRSPENLARLRLREVTDAAAFFRESFVAGQFLQSRSVPPLENRRVFAYDLDLLNYEGVLAGQPLPVGFAVIAEELIDPAAKNPAWVATWEVDELFVPDPLYGAGFVSKLLDAVLRFYRSAASNPGRKFQEVRVNFSGAEASMMGKLATPAKGPNRAAREERVREIEFYKSRGFAHLNPEQDRAGAMRLRAML